MAAAVWLGGVALFAATLVYAALLWMVRRVDRAYPSTDPTESTWWFGYARDAANLLGVLSFWTALALLGLPGPTALLGAFALTMLAYGLDYLCARAIPLERAEVALALLLGCVAILVILGRREIGDELDAVVRTLF